MSKTRIAIISCLMLLPSCAAEQVALKSTLSEQEIAWSRTAGRNTVIGQAAETSTAGFHSCSGIGATAIPDSAYARERMMYLYGNTERGFRKKTNYVPVFANEPAVYKQTWKNVSCDSKGNFTFRNLPNGTYYIIAPVIWKLSESPDEFQGGHHMHAVTLSGGRTVRVKFNE